MTMRRLDLDFHRTASGASRAAWLLLAVALALSADVGWSHWKARQELAELESRLARTHGQPANGMLRVALRPAAPEEMQFARETIARLALPWDRLFAALEFAQSERVALLGVEPDAERGTVIVTGEARDYLSAISYAGTLSNAKGLSRVHLVRHEAKPSDPRRAVLFTISAQWSVAP